jgi:hypothetical protein
VSKVTNLLADFRTNIKNIEGVLDLEEAKKTIEKRYKDLGTWEKQLKEIHGQDVSIKDHPTYALSYIARSNGNYAGYFKMISKIGEIVKPMKESDEYQFESKKQWAAAIINEHGPRVEFVYSGGSYTANSGSKSVGSFKYDTGVNQLSGTGYISESVQLDEAIRSKDFPRATALIKKYFTGKLGKVYFFPMPEVFTPSGGSKGVGIKFFVNGNQAVRMNWAGTNLGISKGLVSVDFWDGSKSPQPTPSHHVKFDENQSLVKVLPFVVDFVLGKIDKAGDSIFVNEEVSAYDLPMVTDFTQVHTINEANYSSGELKKTVTNIIHALEQGISISDQNKMGGVKKYGPRWNKAIEAIKRNHGNLFTKQGLKHIIEPSQVKKIDTAAVLAYISGGDDVIAFTASAGSKEMVEVDGASEQDIERMTYEESLEALQSGVKLLMANATNGLFLAGRGGVGKTANVEDVLAAAGKSDGQGYYKVAGSASPAGMYRILFEHKDEIILFDDADSALGDVEGRNLIKAAADTSKKRKISWLKGGGAYVDPDEYDPDADDGKLPRSFIFTGKIIFISNLAINKLDPDGSLRTRAYLINIDPSNMEMYEFMTKIAGKIKLDVDYPLSLSDRLEVVELLKSRKVADKTVNLRQLVRGLNTRAGIASQGGTTAEWTRFVKMFA